jgi:hypothetical protein
MQGSLSCHRHHSLVRGEEHALAGCVNARVRQIEGPRHFAEERSKDMKHIVFASLVALGVMGFSSAPSQAAPTAPMQPLIGSSDLLQEVSNHRNRDRRQMRRSWDRNRDGERCRYRSNRCRYYRGGYYYANPWWTLPLIGGSIILRSQQQGLSSRHVAWCENRYRSYNRYNNTWVAYSGAVRQCNSPYGP